MSESNIPPICVQPSSGNAVEQTPQNCPPGLEYLMSVKRLFVEQKVEMFEAFTGWETRNKYTIKNQAGEIVYAAFEESDSCDRNCYGNLRPFCLKIINFEEREVILLHRSLVDCPWCFSYPQTMEVYAPPNKLIGIITKQNFFDYFEVMDSVGNVIFKMEKPFFTTSFGGNDVKFKVFSGESEIGKITKKWGGLGRELFTDADFFEVSFPLDLEVRMKILMLAAVFLIDFLYFEDSN